MQLVVTSTVKRGQILELVSVATVAVQRNDVVDLQRIAVRGHVSANLAPPVILGEGTSLWPAPTFWDSTPCDGLTTFYPTVTKLGASE